MDKIYLSLGSNIGDKFLLLSQAIQEINMAVGKVRKISACYETEAWGPIAQEAFVNCVIEIQSNLSPGKLIIALIRIEKLLGRQRQQRYGPRTIDIDILLMGHKIIKQKKLSVPHPFLQERKFVLVPLNDIAAHETHPTLHKTISELLDECKDECNVYKLKRTISL